MKTKNTTSSKLTETASLLKQHSTLAEVLEHIGTDATSESGKFNAKSNVISLSKYRSMQETDGI